MNPIFSLLGLLSLFGGNSHQSKNVALGPLSQMKEFEVVILAPSDQDLEHAVDSFKKIGEVSNADYSSESTSPSLLIFVDTSSKEDLRVSLKVVSEIAIQPSQFKTSSCILEKEYSTGASCYPVDTPNGIAFQKVEREDIDAQGLIDRMTTEFMDQYKHDNPDLVNPRFKIISLR